MHRLNWQTFTLFAVSLVFGLSACEGLQDPPEKKSIAPSATPPKIEDPVDTTGFKPKAAPLPTLPKGCGEIDADAPKELNFTPSGLYYRVLRKSDGKKPTYDDTVRVHYFGKLADGTQFDNSYERGQPAEFGLYGVIPGWTEGMQLIGEGGMIELEIPYQLAYGKAGRPPTIPAKADLRFVVELLAVNPSPAARHGSGKIDVTNFKPKAAPLPKLPEGAGSIDADAPAELVFTKTGLYYRILRKSEGKKAQWNGTVKVHYQGTLDNGEQFDSSYERKEPAEFDLRDVVAGWTEGLQLVGEGGMIELDIPYQLGYGHEGRPPRIPPGANLHFIIEIISVK